MDRQKIIAAVMSSFKAEVAAFKPGNVSAYADGHNMTVQDFLTSAEVSVPHLCQPGKPVGQRVLGSVKATQAAVGCNTNLGMLLLFSPLIVAAESNFKTAFELRSQLQLALDSLTENDTQAVYESICIAAPAGLGELPVHDVRQAPACSLRHAMQLASDRDAIATQYCTAYRDLFSSGLDQIKYFFKRWNSVEWATVSCFMYYLSSIRDSHIERKYGQAIAEQIRIKAMLIAKKFNDLEMPETGLALLQDFDTMLKAEHYNPGTSADLTAATLLVYNLLNH